MRLTRRDFFVSGAAVAGASLLGSRGIGMPIASAADAKRVTLWEIANGQQKRLVQETVKRFDKNHADIDVVVQFFQNNPYKYKLRTAMGAGEPPDLFVGWGGGVLQSYVDSGKVAPVPQSVKTSRFFPSVTQTVTFNGKLYGVPSDGTQPVLFYYNRKIFKKYGISVPKTWKDLLAAVHALRSKGVVPISLAGQSKWPELMYEEYLVNRVGGDKPFQDVVAGKKGAWSHPAFLKANKMIMQLVDMKAFPSDFASLRYSTGQSSQLLYGGDAAMQLMGSWDYQGILSDDPGFVKAGHLGWFPFPKVEGGAGDPRNVSGNPANFYSIAAASKAKAQAATFLSKGVLDKDEVEGMLKIGLVPPIRGLGPKLKTMEHGDWLSAVYDMTANAPSFTLSWDQALHPRIAQAMLTNLSLMFLKQITPEQYSKKMDQAMGS